MLDLDVLDLDVLDVLDLDLVVGGADADPNADVEECRIREETVEVLLLPVVVVLLLVVVVLSIPVIEIALGVIMGVCGGVRVGVRRCDDDDIGIRI